LVNVGGLGKMWVLFIYLFILYKMLLIKRACVKTKN